MYTHKEIKQMDNLFPESPDFSLIQRLSAFEPFSTEAINFLDDLSKKLNKYHSIKSYSDVATFAFFCRKGNLLKLKENFLSSDKQVMLGRGIVFHIAPSNVPVNFAYSFLIGILSGNINIVRVPSKSFEQVDIICHAIKDIESEGKHNFILERLFIIRYDRDNFEATSFFSSICDIRVIWGGDETIKSIREHKLQARSFDITFADRYSICAICSGAFIEEKNPEALVRFFYNDTFLFDQNACTSPHLVVWVGEEDDSQKARLIFWDFLHEFAEAKYNFQPIMGVDKLTNFYLQAVNFNDIKKSYGNSNVLWVSKLNYLETNVDSFRCASGYFSEYFANSLQQINDIITTKYQTLAYFGFSKNELQEFILKNKPHGIDRIVPIGKTSDFSLIWDGYNLISALSRNCEIL